MKHILIIVFLITFVSASLIGMAYAQNSPHSVIISYTNDVAPSYEAPLPDGKQFHLIQSYSWVNDETSRYSLVSYTLDGETVKISRQPRGDFRLDIPTDSSHTVEFTAVLQYGLSVEGTSNFSFYPSSPTQDNWFDEGTLVSVNVSKINEIEKDKVRQIITGWSLDKNEFWEIDDESSSFTTPPINMTEYHQIDFFDEYQFKVNVQSDLGVTTGSGWYTIGDTVPIDVQFSNDGLILNTLVGWDGASVQYDGNVAQVIVDGPVTVVAKYEKNYGLLITVIVVPIFIGAVIAYRRFKTPKSSLKTNSESSETTHNYASDYEQSLSSFFENEAMKKIEEFHSLNLVSSQKHDRLKKEFL